MRKSLSWRRLRGFVGSDAGALGKDALGGCWRGCFALICQSHSTLRKRQMDKGANLFKKYLRVVEFLAPKAFIFENVVGPLSMRKGRLFSCENFKKLGCKIYLGVPQMRQRIVEIRREFGGDLPRAGHANLVSLEQAIDDLPQSVRPAPGYVNTYAKMWWKKPAPTITRNFATPSSSRCIQPRDSRASSIREGARLQGLPDDHAFCVRVGDKRLQRGNALSSLVSVARAMKDDFKKYRKASGSQQHFKEFLSAKGAFEHFEENRPNFSQFKE